MSFDGEVKLSNHGMMAGHRSGGLLEMDEAIAVVRKMTPAQRLTAWATQIGAAFSFVGTGMGDDARSPVEIICNAINPKAMNTALRETFDAADYFKRVPAALVIKAIEEAVNPEEARRVGKLKKKDAVDFAVANVIGTKWLPDELRVAGYDGPGAKITDKTARAKAAEKKAAKPAKKAGKAKKP